MQNEKAAELQTNLRSRIYTVRNVQIMLDYDLAEIYGYEVRALNQQVKRNINRFPEDFMFLLTKDDVYAVKSQIVTSWKPGFFEGQDGGTRKLPNAFTDLGKNALHLKYLTLH